MNLEVVCQDLQQLLCQIVENAKVEAFIFNLPTQFLAIIYHLLIKVPSKAFIVSQALHLHQFIWILYKTARLLI